MRSKQTTLLIWCCRSQLLLGTARLVPTPRFFPLRLRLLRATCRLAAATHTYVPLAAPLLDVLHWAELSKPPKVRASARERVHCWHHAQSLHHALPGPVRVRRAATAPRLTCL